MTSTMEGDVNIAKLTPTTRYQGSKRRILPWLYQNTAHLKFKTALDAFGGTGSVSYLFKLMGKQITFNDILLSNYHTGLAFIENDDITLKQTDIDFIIQKNGFNYPSFIQKTFRDIYFLGSENKWLDTVVYNIEKLSERYNGRILKTKKALAYHALFQACLCKRPFNLFHRRNLYLRTSKVKRTFGNVKTWNTDFSTLFIKFCNEISNKVFSNGYKNKAICKDVLKMKNTDFELVYFDPPYTRPNEKYPNDYYSFYHFLEGMLDYSNWLNRIDWGTKNLSLVKKNTGWKKGDIEINFDLLFRKFRDSKIVVSYGEPGFPSIKTLTSLLSEYKKNVRTIKQKYHYKLNRRNGVGFYEVLIIGE